MIYPLSATKRSNLGRGAKKELKMSRIPAVIYGQGVETQSLSVPKVEFIRILSTAGSSSLLDVTVEQGTPVKALIKSVQVDPRSLEPIHVDLHQVRMDKAITAEVPLKFIGEAPAVKTGGGTLVKSMDMMIVTCLPADLPHEIEVDLSKLVTFEDAITVASLNLGKGVSVKAEDTATIATVAAPLTEEQLKKMEESAVGDITAVKSDVEEKRAAKEAAAAATAPEAGKKAEPAKKADKK